MPIPLLPRPLPQQRSDDQVLEKVGDAHFFPTTVGAIGILSNFYFKITGNQSDSRNVDKSLSIIKAFNEIESTSSSTSRIFEVFSKRLNVPFERIVYERQDVFQFDFAKDFWFALPPSTSEYRYFAHQSSSDEEARLLYDRLYEENLFDNSLITRTSQSAVMKHNFLDSLLSLNLKGSYVFGSL